MSLAIGSTLAWDIRFDSLLCSVIEQNTGDRISITAGLTSYNMGANPEIKWIIPNVVEI
jgi:hypothetical protein